MNPLLTTAEIGKSKPCTFDLPDNVFGCPSRRVKNDFESTQSCILNTENVPTVSSKRRTKKHQSPAKNSDQMFGVKNPGSDPLETKNILQFRYQTESNTCSSHASSKKLLIKHTKASVGHDCHSKQASECKKPFKISRFEKVPPRVPIPKAGSN
ncbi:hypothetical protein GEMRC1_003102 [Eukaryota sp. GEM-RC1]